MKGYTASLFYDEYLQGAIERMKDAYKFSQHLGLGKLYVGFSGGKDSVCLYGVSRLAARELKIDVLDMCEFHYNVTGIDHPALVYFMNEFFPFVIREMYQKSMWQLMRENEIYPTRLMRYCCRELKEHGGEGRFCVMGVRWAESSARAKRSEFESIGATRKDGVMLNSDNTEDRKTLEHCIPKNKYVCNPLIEWTDDMVWEFIDREDLPYCGLYDQGWKRLGCLFCPNASQAEKVKMREMYPGMEKAFVRVFNQIIDIRKAKGKKCTWKDGQEMFNQFISK